LGVENKAFQKVKIIVWVLKMQFFAPAAGLRNTTSLSM